MKPYIFLILTILFESAAVVFMKMSHGFTNKLQAAMAIVCYLVSFIFLTMGLKNLPMGWANAIWAGSSTVLVALFSMYYFKENLNMYQLFFLLLIVTGLIGLNLQTKA